MPEKIVQLKEEVIKGQLKELVRGSVEETLYEMMEAGSEKLMQQSDARAMRHDRAIETAAMIVISQRSSVM